MNENIKDNLKIKRGSVWICDLDIYKTTDHHMQTGKRPVIVVSNNNCNINSNVIQIVPITTRHTNKLPTHVFIGDKFGLDKNSIALIEAETSIDIQFLKNKIGELNNIKMEEIDRAIRIQHGFIGKFSIEYIDMFINKIIDMNDEYDNIKQIIKLNFKNYIEKYAPEFEEFLINKRDEIAQLFINKQYELCLENCNKMLSISKLINSSYDIWFYNFRIAMCYHAINQYEESIKYNSIAMNYTQNNRDAKYIENLWLLAMCYEKTNDIKKSVKYYNKCIDLCLKFNYLEKLADLKHNVGFITKNYLEIQEAIKIRQTHRFKTNDIMLKIYYKSLNELIGESNETNK